MVVDRLVHAVRELWNIDRDFEEQLSVQELQDDWVVWRKQDEGKAGGLRLIVPKRGTQAFEIPSSASADDENGVSWEYTILVRHAEKATKEAAAIVEKHTGMSRVEAYNGLKSGFPASRSYFIAAPLELLRELRSLNVDVRLVRPGDQGEYS
jgi:hypothetical protein